MNDRDYLNEPGVWITPARQSGAPCIIGTRIPVSHVENYMWSGYDIAAYCDDFAVTYEQVICAAWVAVDCGLLRRKKCRKAWESWADKFAIEALTGRWQDIPCPPSKKGSVDAPPPPPTYPNNPPKGS